MNFPDCAKNCNCIEFFGVSEYESICPEKFKTEYVIRTSIRFNLETFKNHMKNYDPNIFVYPENNPVTFWIKTDKSLNELFKIPYITDIIEMQI